MGDRAATRRRRNCRRRNARRRHRRRRRPRHQQRHRRSSTEPATSAGRHGAVEPGQHPARLPGQPRNAPTSSTPPGRRGHRTTGHRRRPSRRNDCQPTSPRAVDKVDDAITRADRVARDTPHSTGVQESVQRMKKQRQDLLAGLTKAVAEIGEVYTKLLELDHHHRNTRRSHRRSRRSMPCQPNPGRHPGSVRRSRRTPIRPDRNRRHPHPVVRTRKTYRPLASPPPPPCRYGCRNESAKSSASLSVSTSTGR